MDKSLKHLSNNDARLKYLIKNYPAPDFQAHDNYYQEIVSSIISQQLSVKSASSIEARVINLFGSQLPSPEQIIQTQDDALRQVGLSRPKITYLKDLANKIIHHELIFDNFINMSNQEIIVELTKVKGIGVWTAHMFLMFCMARLDVLPVGDLGIRNGISKLYSLDHVATADDIEQIALTNNWHPYESVASWYVWQSLGNKPIL